MHFDELIKYKVQVKIVDFGYSRLLGANLSIANSLGYPLTLAPEQLSISDVTDMAHRKGANY